MRTPVPILLVVAVAAATTGCGNATYIHHYSLKYPKITFSTETCSSSAFTTIPSDLEGFSTGYRIEGEEFTGGNEVVTGRTAGEGVAEVFVRLGGETYFLPDLPQVAVEELCGEGWQPETYDPKGGMQFQGTAIPQNYLSASLIHYEYPPDVGTSHFRFMNGRLFSADVTCGPGWLEVSSSKEGPFLKFPIADKDLIAMFGKPTKESKGTRRLRGCMDPF
ncbi:MAG: hypothetical protein ACYTG0_23440 [Planctomycetota bacterium]|jgi:hypothetical protein